MSNDTAKGLVWPLHSLLVILALRAALVQQRLTMLCFYWAAMGSFAWGGSRAFRSMECMFSREFIVFVQRKGPTWVSKTIKNKRRWHSGGCMYASGVRSQKADQGPLEWSETPPQEGRVYLGLGGV